MKKPVWAAAGLLWFACLLFVTPPAHAHKAMAFAYVEGGQVQAEGYFADGKKLGDSPVEVFDAQGLKILEGRTDSEGVFSFPLPGEGRVRIVITGSMGHRAECFAGGGMSEAQAGAQVANEPMDGTPGIEEAASDMQAFRAVIAQELEKSLKPLRQEIRDLKEDRPSITEIVGGIGYLMGIMGIIMYFKAGARKGP